MAKEYLDQLTTLIEKTTSGQFPEVQLECKHFFSGAALYVNGKICGSLTPVGLALKLPEKTKNRLLKSEKAIPLQYFPKAPIKKEYVLFPAGIHENLRTLRKYIRESIEYVLS